MKLIFFIRSEFEKLQPFWDQKSTFFSENLPVTGFENFPKSLHARYVASGFAEAKFLHSYPSELLHQWFKINWVLVLFSVIAGFPRGALVLLICIFCFGFALRPKNCETVSSVDISSRFFLPHSKLHYRQGGRHVWKAIFNHSLWCTGYNWSDNLRPW